MTVQKSVLAIALSLTTLGAVQLAHAQGTTRAPQQSSIVNEQVKNDLADWRKAGFDAQSYDVLSYDVFGNAYQKRYAKYEKLQQLHTRQSVKN